MDDSPSKSDFKSCSFCPNEKQELYKCPQCFDYFCSQRCFRSKKHIKCSEEFYRKQCEKHIELNSADSSISNSSERRGTKITTFEQYMAQQGQQSSTNVNPQIAVRADEEILFDSDDEPEYLSKMVDSTLEQFNSLDEEELNRRILNAGLPISLGDGAEHSPSEESSQEQMEYLYQQLTNEEKTKFTQLADEILCNDLQKEMNCFQRK